MNRFCWGSFTETDESEPFFDTSGEFIVGYVEDTDLVFWQI